MRKLTLTLIAGAAALAGGAASAQTAPAPKAPRPPMTRAAVEQRSAQLFDRLDANHDGRIDQADRAARQKARFDRVDANHDGQVSYAEFTAMHEQRGDRAGQRGERAGRDGGQGRGSAHRQAMGGGFRARGAIGMTRLADADKDGAVTKAEFQAAAVARFDRLDANKDGTVTPDEAKAARDSMREQWQAHREARTS